MDLLIKCPAADLYVLDLVLLLFSNMKNERENVPKKVTNHKLIDSLSLYY